jgi:hypothetical protein
METGKWNARILCQSVSLKTGARELDKYKLDFIGGRG